MKRLIQSPSIPQVNGAHLSQHRWAPTIPASVVYTLAPVLTSNNHLLTPCNVTVIHQCDQPFLRCGKGAFRLRFAEALQCSSPANGEHKTRPDTKSPAQCCQSKKTPLH